MNHHTLVVPVAVWMAVHPRVQVVRVWDDVEALGAEVAGALDQDRPPADLQVAPLCLQPPVSERVVT